MTSSSENSVVEQTTPSARKSAKSRSQLRADLKRQEELERAARLADFEVRRFDKWAYLWSRSLQMALLIQKDDLATTGSNAFQFENFRVMIEPGEESIQQDRMFPRLTLDNLTLDNFESAVCNLDDLYATRIDEMSSREMAKQEAERLKQAQKTGLAKLTDQEIKAIEKLGFRKL